MKKISPKPALALAKATESKPAVHLRVVDTQFVTEPPKGFMSSYAHKQYLKQRAQLDTNAAAKAAKDHFAEQVPAHTFISMTCPWSIAGRKPNSP